MGICQVRDQECLVMLSVILLSFNFYVCCVTVSSAAVKEVV
jgi:hypothetical protein